MNVNKLVLVAVLFGFGMIAPVLAEAKDNALPQVQQIEARGGNGGGHFAPGGRDYRGMPQPARPMPAPQPGPEYRSEPMPTPAPVVVDPVPEPAPMPVAPIVITFPGIHIQIGG